MKRRMREDEIVGFEIFPDSGKENHLQVRGISKKAFSNKTSNKLSDITYKQDTVKPTASQLSTVKAAYDALKAKGKEDDVKKAFRIDPKPDVTLKANGDVEITPDDGGESYHIPERDLVKYENRVKNMRLASKKARKMFTESDASVQHKVTFTFETGLEVSPMYNEEPIGDASLADLTKEDFPKSLLRKYAREAKNRFKKGIPYVLDPEDFFDYLGEYFDTGDLESADIYVDVDSFTVKVDCIVCEGVLPTESFVAELADAVDLTINNYWFDAEDPDYSVALVDRERPVYMLCREATGETEFFFKLEDAAACAEDEDEILEDEINVYLTTERLLGAKVVAL